MAYFIEQVFLSNLVRQGVCVTRTPTVPLTLIIHSHRQERQAPLLGVEHRRQDLAEGGNVFIFYYDNFHTVRDKQKT